MRKYIISCAVLLIGASIAFGLFVDKGNAMEDRLGNNSADEIGAYVHVLDESTERVVIHELMEIWVDYDQQAFTVDELITADLIDQFELHTGEAPNFGYGIEYYWVRFQLQNLSQNEEWFLEVSGPKLAIANLFEEDKTGTYMMREMGMQYPFANREVDHRNLIFPIHLESGQLQTFYMAIASAGSTQFPLTLYTTEAFLGKSQVEYLLFGLLFGLFVVMAIYNLFLFFSVKDRSYLFYVLFIMASISLYIADTGFGAQYIWKDLPLQVWLDVIRWQPVITFMSLASITGLLFTRSFLETYKRTPRIDKMMKIVIYICLGAVILAQLRYTYNIGNINISLGSSIMIVMACISVSIILIVTAAVICLRQGFRPARFFLLAWSLYLVGVTVSQLVDAGVLSLSIWSRYAYLFTGATEVVLLSFALGDKISTIRAEKESAERAAKESQQKYAEELERFNQEISEINVHLEDLVQERTEELQLSNKELIRVNEELVELENSKSRLLLHISHDLGAPLTFLKGYVHTMQEGIISSNQQGKYLNMLEGKVHMLSRLADDLFYIAKLKAGNLRMETNDVNLSQWLLKVYSKFELIVENEGVQLQLLGMESDQLQDLVVRVDMERMDQVFANLIFNALKFTPAGGVISLQAEASMEIKQSKVISNIDHEEENLLEQQPEEIAMKEQDVNDEIAVGSELDTMVGEVIIRIQDNGMGISEEDMKHIFDRFYQGKINSEERLSGTGLGLAIAKEIVEHHQGQIWVESALGEGSSFYIKIPSYEQKQI